MKRKEILILSIGVFSTVIALLAADIYHLNIHAKIKNEVNVPQLKNYKISKELLDELEKKTQ